MMTSDEVGPALLAALGLTTTGVQRIELVLEAGEPVRVRVTSIPNFLQLSEVKFDEYELVRKEAVPE